MYIFRVSGFSVALNVLLSAQIFCHFCSIFSGSYLSISILYHFLEKTKDICWFIKMKRLVAMYYNKFSAFRAFLMAGRSNPTIFLSPITVTGTAEISSAVDASSSSYLTPSSSSQSINA